MFVYRPETFRPYSEIHVEAQHTKSYDCRSEIFCFSISVIRVGEGRNTTNEACASLCFFALGRYDVRRFMEIFWASCTSKASSSTFSYFGRHGQRS